MEKKIIVSAAAFASLLIILGAYLLLKPEGLTYNGHAFTKNNGLWILNSNEELAFRFSPMEVEAEKIKGLDSSFITNKTYILVNTQGGASRHEELSSIELITNIKHGLGVTLRYACMANTTLACKNRPTVTCGTPQTKVIFIQEGPSFVTFNKTCLLISGNRNELYKGSDRVLYQLLGVNQ